MRVAVQAHPLSGFMNVSDRASLIPDMSPAVTGSETHDDAVARFLAQFSTTCRAEAVHLALRALRARVEPDRVLACELAWEVHTRGYWSQLRSQDGRPYDSEESYFETFSGWPRGGRPTSAWRSAACFGRSRSRGAGTRAPGWVGLPTWAEWSGRWQRGLRMIRRRVRIGVAARRWIRAGGPRAGGRPAASVAEWAAIRAAVLARAGWVCEACGVRGRLDVHHVQKRSQGGSDFDQDQLVGLCRGCHEQTDAAFDRGRLVTRR